MYVVRTDKGFIRRAAFEPQGDCRFDLAVDKADALRCEAVAATMVQVGVIESGLYKWAVIIDEDAAGTWDFEDDDLREIARDPLGYDTRKFEGLDLVREMARREKAGLTRHAVERELRSIRPLFGRKRRS